MNYTKTQTASNEYEIIVTVEPEVFEAALDYIFESSRSYMNVPDVAPADLTREAVEAHYGKDVFYSEAFSKVCYDTFFSGVDSELGIENKSTPKVDPVQCEAGKELIYKVTFATLPEIKLGDYRNLVLDKSLLPSNEPSEEEIDAKIKENLASLAKDMPSNEPAEMGDTAIINFKGYLDGVPFAGGEAKDFNLLLGSHSFVDTFEDQIVGHCADDTFDVYVTFPQSYPAQNLAGKQTRFEVVLVHVLKKSLPELSDETVKQISSFETVEEYRKSVADDLAHGKKTEFTNARLDAIINAIAGISEMEDIHELFILGEAEDMINQMMQQDPSLRSQRIDDAFMNAFIEKNRDALVINIKGKIISNAIAKAEGFEAGEPEILKFLETMAAQYKTNPEAIYAAFSDEDKKLLGEDLTKQRVVDFLLETVEFR